MEQKIYIKDWLELKPYDKQAKTDTYYLKICNDVKKVIVNHKQSFVLSTYLDEKDIKVLSCFLTSYFEDIISETNIWNSFVKIHKRLYKKQLPFYVLDEYYEEEINLQDVSFLIWYFLNTIQQDKFIAPFNDFISEIAEVVMDVFDKNWGDAPVNEHLKSFYQIDEKESDFYVVRNFIDRILFQTYLFCIETNLSLREQELEIINVEAIDETILFLLNENRDNAVNKTHTRLLNLMGKEWAAEILGNNHGLSKDILNISQRISGFFFYKGQDDDNVFIEHIASSKKFDLTKISFDHSDSLKKEDTILFLGIVKWRDEWWFSGMSFDQPYNPDLILDQKNSVDARASVNFLDHDDARAEETIKMELDAFLASNNGKQIAFMPAEKIESFVKNYIEVFNNSLKMSKKEINKAKKRATKDGFFGTEEGVVDFSDVSETSLAFFNPKSGLEIAFDVNSAFPLPNNPFFNADDSEESIMRVLVSDDISAELAYYCIDNCKDNLPFFNAGVGKEYLKDIDFFLRFWKKNNYHAKPLVTYIGEKNY
ncbi:MAG: DUF3843 family protein [Bacteroidales bacterium]|nr:DUF3843 family protein [Bacteroidales bacterium]